MKHNISKAIGRAVFVIALTFATAPLFAQVKIGTNPTTIGANNNLEVEASTAGRKTSVDKTTGQVTIADGTQGAGKVLTSDANGGASWIATKRTGISTNAQTSPGIVIPIAPGAGGTYCALPVIGAMNPPACATDTHRDAVFSTSTATNDVVIDMTGMYTVGANNGTVQFILTLYMDKTTPGVMEVIDYLVITNTATGCSGDYINFKTTLKNLPARTYNLKVYETNHYNGGTTTANIGLGAASLPGCGIADFPNQKLTVSVSE